MKLIKTISMILMILCILCIPVPATAVSQGTDGTELEIVQPETLELHLGKTWAGAKFELRTEAGRYPDLIPADDNGILRLEIGGSPSYILTRMDAPIAPTEETGTETEAPAETATAPVETDTPPDNIVSVTEQEDDTVAGIPVAHIVIFIIGLLIAIVTLIGISFYSKKNDVNTIDENDDF